MPRLFKQKKTNPNELNWSVQIESHQVQIALWRLTSGLLDFGGAGFGHLDGGLTLSVEQRSLQRS